MTTKEKRTYLRQIDHDCHMDSADGCPWCAALYHANRQAVDRLYRLYGPQEFQFDPFSFIVGILLGLELVITIFSFYDALR